jgi:2-methylcitrate dehydratase PrpD
MNNRQSVAAFFAEKVSDLRFEDFLSEEVHWAKIGILDTVGVTLAGANEPCAQILSEALDGSVGQSIIFGQAKTCSALDAALINGTASHALDFDDCNNTMGGHPSVPILPALFALVDELNVSGKDFMTAYIAGFEVETKLAMMVNFHHYTKGWHPTATLGVFGAAAACSKLLNLNAQQTQVALALAASGAAGIKANFGSMTKPMHIGRCAREGLLAAKLAKAGYTANTTDVFEHPQGFLEVYNGKGNYDTSRGLLAWAAPFDIVKPGIAIKQYPCCGSTHPAIDCAIELFQNNQLNPDSIETVDIWIHERRLQHTNRSEPRSELDAKFSVQYVVARALLEGCVSLAHFEGDAYSDQTVRSFMKKINAQPYDAIQFASDNHFGGQVCIKLRTGEVLEAKVQQPLGRTSDNPLPKDRLKKKFDLCGNGIISEKSLESLYVLIDSLESVNDMRQLTSLLHTHS